MYLASVRAVRLRLESVTGVPVVIAASLLLGHDRRGVLLRRTWLVVWYTSYVVVVDVYGGHNCVYRRVCSRAHLGRGRDHVQGTASPTCHAFATNAWRTDANTFIYW